MIEWTVMTEDRVFAMVWDRGVVTIVETALLPGGFVLTVDVLHLPAPRPPAFATRKS